MTPDIYIDTLLKKYQKAPSFPFQDWVENPVSFCALINIWDEIFKTAAGKLAGDYVAYGEAQQDEYSLIYQVKHKERNILIGITPSWPAGESKIGGDFGVLESIYPPEMQPKDDKYELGMTCDLERNRLVCNFLMMRHFTHNLPESHSDVERYNTMYIENYGQYFGFPDFNPYNSPLFPITEPDDDDDED